MNAPPGIHTRTGRGAAASTGAQTLRKRQSSSTPLASARNPGRGDSSATACGVPGPKASAGRTPVHGVTGSGGRQRSAPTGGAAYGTPRNRRSAVPSGAATAAPSNLPAAVSTTLPLTGRTSLMT